MCGVCACVRYPHPGFPTSDAFQAKAQSTQILGGGGGILQIYEFDGLSRGVLFFFLHRFASMHTYVSLLNPGHIHELLHFLISYTTDRIDRFYPQK